MNENKVLIETKSQPPTLSSYWVTWGSNDIAIPEQHWKTEDKWLVILYHLLCEREGKVLAKL